MALLVRLWLYCPLHFRWREAQNPFATFILKPSTVAWTILLLQNTLCWENVILCYFNFAYMNICHQLLKVKVKVTQSCLTLCDPVDYSVHGILQARILEWVAFPFSKWSSQLRGQTQVSHIAGWFFTSWATGEETKISESHTPTNVTMTHHVKMNLRQALIIASPGWRLVELQGCIPLSCIALKDPAGS